MKSHSLLRAVIRTMLIESATPKISDLTREDIILVLEDILGREPLASYTEKLAGQNLTVYIRDGQVTGQFKGYEEADWADLSGVANTVRKSNIPNETKNAKYSFEILKPENRPDYIDYAIGDKTVVIEFGGLLTKEDAIELNRVSGERLKFLTKNDIVKMPKPLSEKTRSKMAGFLSQLQSSLKVSKLQKQEIELAISEALIEIFGESIFGGTPEGVFVTGTSKGFKIPEKTYADVQRVSVPLYAILSSKSNIPIANIIRRFEDLANANITSSDKMISDFKRYLEKAKDGFSPGFKTFFNRAEASELLDTFNEIENGNANSATDFVKTFSKRIKDKSSWQST